MTQSDVLIIGAGPSGTFAAAELARHGVNARLIERDEQPHRQARATSIQPGTLEILESVGLLQPFLDAAERICCSRMYGPGMVELGSSSHAGIDCMCKFQCSLPQYETQRILTRHLESLGGTIERGVTATSVESDADGFVVELLHADGRRETLRPRFVIGAGGAHSVTRHSMNESMDGATYRGNFLVADIAMPAPFPRDEAGVICSPQGLLLLAPLPGGRWITFQDLEEGVEEVAADDVAVRVEARLSGRFRPTDVGWYAPFRMHRRIVSRFADGRRFLIGDAAHLSSPFGGEGLNSGLHDGYDLAWKLALVIRGHARPSLLEHYVAERRMADQHVLQVSDQVHTAVAEMADGARKGDLLKLPAVDPISAALQANARAMIDVDYSGSPLIADFGAGQGNTIGPRPGQRYPDRRELASTSHHVLVFGNFADGNTFERMNRQWSRLVHFAHNPNLDPVRAGVSAGGVVTIRPDGHIGFRFPSTDDEAFAALGRHLDSYLVPENAKV